MERRREDGESGRRPGQEENKREIDGGGKKDGGKDGWRRSVNGTVRFCFAPLAVSRLLVFHALLQRRVLLGPVYSLSASLLLHLCLFFTHTHTQREWPQFITQVVSALQHP